MLAEKFDKYTKENSTKTPEPATHYSLPEIRKAEDFVGLRNLGATCYVNSFLQQLFMIDAFRNKLLSTTFQYEDGLKNFGESQITVSIGNSIGGQDLNDSSPQSDTNIVSIFDPTKNYDAELGAFLEENLVWQHQVLFANML